MATDIPTVKNVLIPLDRYPHLNENQTLHDAVSELKLFTAGAKNRLRYNMLLVVNDQNQLIGKVTLADMLKALFPPLYESVKMKKFEGQETTFPNLAILLEDTILKECPAKASLPVKDFMSDTENYIQAETQILKTLMIMLNSGNYTLPVIEEDKIIGVIRHEEIFDAMCIHCNL